MNNSSSARRSFSMGVKVSALSIILCVLFTTRSVIAQNVGLNFNNLIKDIMKIEMNPDDPNAETVVFLMPREYWELTSGTDPTIPPRAREEMLSTLRPYLIVAVLDGKMGYMGKLSFTDKETVKSLSRIEDINGNIYKPLEDYEIDVTAKTLLEVIKPFVSNMLGPIGEGMQFLAFPAWDKEGNALFDAKNEGIFIFYFGDRKFQWRLPLCSIVPPKICANGESVCGAYKYCPYDGIKFPE